MRRRRTGWLTVGQAARRLRVSREDVYRLIDEGRLPAYRIGSAVRLLAADVEAYRLGDPGDHA